jgi:large subunit ribosomal protein L28
VSHANNKTKRRFNPNVHWVRLSSQVMRKTVSLKLSTQGMKTIDKHGGLDGFLSKTGASKLSGEMLRLKREFQKSSPVLA